MINLFKNGTYHRRPDGYGNTLVNDQKAAGIEWALLNVGVDVNRDPTVWTKQRALYKNASIPCGPWMHVRSMDDLTFLLSVAVDWQADIIGPNLEDIVDDGLSLQEVGGYLLDFWVNPYGKPVHIATLPWVQNGQGWQYVDFAYLALEMFPKEGQGQTYLDQWQRCCDHAYLEGAKKVTLLFSTTSPRSVYPNVAHCLYTADDVTDWSKWKDSVPQPVPQPPTPPSPPEVPMLTAKQFPYTGPCYGPGTKQTLNYSTVKGLKRAMIRLQLLDQDLGDETDDYGPELKAAMKKYQKSVNLTATGDYGRGTWTALRYEKLELGPNKGQYAMDSKALSYVKEDVLKLVYPHPEGSLSTVCQGLHQTDGLYGNWAIDFCAPGGTPVVAVERALVTRLSGHDPSLPPNNLIGIWGWTIYYTTPDGVYEYFSTHYGSRLVKVGQLVELGQALGQVGSWPGNPGRSHTHLGVSSKLGAADAKKKITAISAAPRIPQL